MNEAELEDERSFLLRSIEDLDRELAAGDLSEPDYAALRDRYMVRAAEVLRALDGAPGADGPPREPARSVDRRTAAEPGTGEPGHSATPGRRPRRPRRGLLVMGVVALVAGVSAVVVLTQTGVRLPGDTSSGSLSLGRADELRRTVAQAEALEVNGDAAGALHLYRRVLSTDPTQVDALAQSGWLEFQAGVTARDGAVIAHAQSLEEHAVRVDPGAYAPHLYLGSMLLAENDAVGAQQQYRLFLADHPPAAQIRAAASFIDRAFSATGQVPPPLPTGPAPAP